MRLLMITSRFPIPLDKGDKLRAFYQLKELSCSNEIHLISLTEKDVSDDDKNRLNKICKTIHVFKLSKWKIYINLLLGLASDKPFQIKYFYQRKIHKQIHKLIKELNPDHIYCQLIRCVLYIKDEHHYKKTIDYMDAFSKGFERRISSAGWLKPVYRIEAKRLKKFENLAYEYFDHHTIISGQDRSFIFHEKMDNISIISNGLDTSYFHPLNNKKKYDLVFVGNLNYPPNIDTSIFLVKELLPEIARSYPDISLLLSGANPHRSVLQLQDKHIKVQGWTKDIRQAYSSGKIFIAPMRLGTGLQNKLLEAMSMGIPCVTSELANLTLKAEKDKEIMVGHTKDEFISHTINLLKNVELRNHIGENGRKFILSNFNWKSTVGDLQRLMNK